MTVRELQAGRHGWTNAISRWNLEIHRQELQELHDSARVPGVTSLGKSSRSVMPGQELK